MAYKDRSKVSYNSIVYIIAYVIGHAYVFITLPILTLNLNGEEFGLYIIIVQIVTIMQMLSAALFGQALLRQHIDYDGEEKKRFVGTMLLAVLIFSFTIAFVSYNWQGFIFENLYPNVSLPTNDYFFYACLWSVAVSIRSVAMTFLKAIEKPKAILFQNLLYGSLLVISLLFFVGHLQQGLLGAIKGLLVAETIAQVVLAFHLKHYVTVKPHIGYLYKAVMFSWPLLPGALAMLAYTNLDRILLSQFVTLHEIGMYGFGLMIGNVAALGVSAYVSSYSPRLIGFSGSNDRKAVSKLASQLMMDNVAFLGPIISALFIAAGLLVALLEGENDFNNATIIICGIATGHFVRSLYLFFSNCLFLYGRSMAILCLNIMLLLVGWMIVYCFAKYAGVYGVAFASAVAFFIMIPFGKVVSRKILKIEFPVKESLMALFVICCLFVCEVVIIGFDFKISNYEYWILKVVECAIVYIVWRASIYDLFLKIKKYS